MNKNILFIIVLSSLISCKTKDIKRNNIQKNGFVSYDFKVNTDQKSLKIELEKMYEDAENKEDSLITKGIIEGSLKALERDKNISFEENYFFINDTVKINTIEQETVFIPKTFTKYVDWKKGRFKRKYISKLDSVYKSWNTTYEIKIDKKDVKKILDIKGYKVKIIETRVGSYDTYINVSELYVSDKHKYPFNYYNFLDLKRNLTLQGLILESKSYLKETPGLFNLYTLKDFNISKQDSNLIKLSKFNSVK